MKIGFYVICFTFFLSRKFLYVLKRPVIAAQKVQNVLWRVQNLPISSSLKNAVILCGTNNLQHDSPEDIVDSIIEIGHCFRKRQHHINISICVLLLRDECTSINRVYVIETNKI